MLKKYKLHVIETSGSAVKTTAEVMSLFFVLMGTFQWSYIIKIFLLKYQTLDFSIFVEYNISTNVEIRRPYYERNKASAGK